MKVEEIARVAHEANRAYCLALGDNSQPSWDSAPEWQKESAVKGVQFHLDNPGSTPADSHAAWLTEKFAKGWVYGPIQNAHIKQHPCCVPYSELPASQRRKDALFLAVVRALA